MAVFHARHFRRGSRVGLGVGWMEVGVVVMTIKEIIVAWKTAEPVLKKVWRIIRRRQDAKRSKRNGDSHVIIDDGVRDDHPDN